MSIAEPKPAESKLRWYQYRLRTLLAVVTLFAVLCSLAKCIGLGAVVAVTVMVGIAASVFLPFYLSGQWLIRNGRRLAGLGYIVSAALMAFPFVVYMMVKLVETVVLGPESGDGNPIELLVVLFLTGCGFAGLFVCFYVSFSFLADHEVQRNLHREKTSAQQSSDASAKSRRPQNGDQQ